MFRSWIVVWSLLLIGATLLGGCALPTTGDGPRLDAVGSAPLPPDPALRALCLAIDDSLREGGSIRTRLDPVSRSALDQDVAPRVVLVSWTNGAATAIVRSGSGRGLIAATEIAVALLRPEIDARVSWGVSIDIVDSVAPLEWSPGERRSIKLDRARDGLAFTSGTLLLSEELRARAWISPAGRFRPPALDRDLATPTHRFTTRTFATLGENAVEIRDRRVMDAEEQPLDNRLELALRRAESYLSVVDEEGKFIYQIDTSTGELDPSYNLARHAGTLFALVDLYAESRSPATLEACSKAIAFLSAYAKVPPPVDDIDPRFAGHEAKVIVEEGQLKLTAIGLGCLAIAQYVAQTGDATYQTLGQALGAHIASLQRPDGRFTRHLESFARRLDTGRTSPYAPGEADLALCRLYELDRDERWLDVAEQNLRYLIEVRDRDIEREPHDHWMLYALDAMDKHRPNRRYVEKARRIVKSIVATQNLDPGPRHGAWLGRDGARVAPAATRVEGLMAAARLFRRAGEMDLAREAVATAERGVGFLLRTQIAPEASFHLRVPRSMTGGFRARLDRDEVRIDFVQHAASAILALREWRRESGSG